MWLGGGANELAVSGEVGSLSVRGSDGADLISIAEGAVVAGGVSVRLGGDNSVDIAGAVDRHLMTAARNGAIDGNVSVMSTSENDSITLAENTAVGGPLELGLGEKTARHGRDGCSGGLHDLVHEGRHVGFFLRRPGDGEPTTRAASCGVLRVTTATIQRGTFR
ncbi:hypothetical protein Pla123a_19390 [Posidoniimonas polymericola]|uniref:Uncharacterized protein n=1 Tax=Posidoniimonas polymericola TaxID=2528002 RepID=A0A5C5YQP9_9BACT|nr:hypothetical protein Pla123a_19390 [Posidoniimonas polymericola]